MKRLNRKQKLLAFFVLALLGLLLAPFVVVQIQEWIFRYRAERVLADVRSLIIHKAPAREVEAVFRRWNPDRLKGCCAIDEVLGHPVHDWSPDPDASTWSSIWSYLFFLGRGRDASLQVRAEFKAGTVTRMWYFVRACTSGPEPDNANDRMTGILHAEIGLDSHLSLEYLWEGLAIHPKYSLIDRDLSGGTDIPFGEAVVDFAYNANPADIERLTEIDFSCFTRLFQCRTNADMMPAVAAQYASEKPQLARMKKERPCR
jgi:hypothetical protein